MTFFVKGNKQFICFLRFLFRIVYFFNLSCFFTWVKFFLGNRDFMNGIFHFIRNYDAGHSYRFFSVLFMLCFGKVNAEAQYSMGTSGMLNTPSAVMNETGTFMIGGNYLPEDMVPFGYNTGNYFAGITLFSFLELNYRGTLLKTTYMTDKPKFNQQDRSMSVKLRVLKEGRFFPALAIGTHDPFADLGNNYYQGYYGVLTKSFGLGGCLLEVSAGYMGYTGEKNKLNDGVFGGVTFRPAFYRDLSFIAEYDTRVVNMGVAARLWKHLSVHAYISDFKCFSGGLRYECRLIH